MTAYLSLYNAIGNLDVYSMFYSFSSLDNNKNITAITVIGFVSNKSTTLLTYSQVMKISKIPHIK